MKPPRLTSAELDRLRAERRSRRYGWWPRLYFFSGTVVVAVALLSLGLAAVGGYDAIVSGKLTTEQVFHQGVLVVVLLVIGLLTLFTGFVLVRRRAQIRIALGCRHLFSFDGYRWQRIAYREMGDIFLAHDQLLIGRHGAATVAIAQPGSEHDALPLIAELKRRRDHFSERYDDLES